MSELNSPLPLFEAPSRKARRRKHCALVVQTWVPNPEPEQNLHCRPVGQQKAAQLPVVSACPGKSPNCRSQPKRLLSEKDGAAGNFRERGNKGTLAMSARAEQPVKLPLVAKRRVSRLANRFIGPRRLPLPHRPQFSSVESHKPASPLLIQG